MGSHDRTARFLQAISEHCPSLRVESAALGDPAYDFAGLASGYGQPFVLRCAQVYPEVAGMLPRVRFHRGTFALVEALFGVENDDDPAFRRGIEGFV